MNMMKAVQIGQACDTLHANLFNGISEKSDNEKFTLPKYTDFTPLIDAKWLTSALLIVYKHANMV